MMTSFRFTSMLLVMGLGWGMPRQSMGQDRTITVQVPANQAWTSTGVTLSPGMTVQIEASGTVEASSSSDTRPFYHQVPPDGRLERHADKPAPLLLALSLLGRIGTGPVLLVGARAQFTVGPPYGSGQLFLGINDDMVTDNAGAWTARITILSSSTQPPPPTTGVAIRTKKAVYAPNEPIVVEFSGFPATNDWITVVEPSAPASSYGQSIYNRGSRSATKRGDGWWEDR
jgi:hypothetical protein